MLTLHTYTHIQFWNKGSTAGKIKKNKLTLSTSPKKYFSSFQANKHKPNQNS